MKQSFFVWMFAELIVHKSLKHCNLEVGRLEIMPQAVPSNERIRMQSPGYVLKN
jgi:hypothetical protein